MLLKNHRHSGLDPESSILNCRLTGGSLSGTVGCMNGHIHVECYAGHRADEEPRAFTLGERRFEVVSILDRWLSPDHRYFKVTAEDGNTYILRQNTATGAWTLQSYWKGTKNSR
jgi:hypothetical protein